MKELKYINKYFKKYAVQLLLGIFITIIARVFSLVTPSYVKKSIKVLENYGNNLISKSEAKEILLEHILIILGTALLAALFTFLMRQTIIKVSRFIEYDLKNEVFDHYQFLNLNF